MRKLTSMLFFLSFCISLSFIALADGGEKPKGSKEGKPEKEKIDENAEGHKDGIKENSGKIKSKIFLPAGQPIDFDSEIDK